MEMMRLLLLLAAATRAKELSFGRDGVELFGEAWRFKGRGHCTDPHGANSRSHPWNALATILLRSTLTQLPKIVGFLD